MRLIVDSHADLRAAAYIKQRILSVAPSASRPFILGLPTGSTPLGMYRQLVEFHRQGELSFRHVVTFNMDEYVGLPEDDPQSYHSFMNQNFFQYVDIPAEQTHILDGNAADLEIECEKYEARIQSLGGVDLFVGGVGKNGHIAFNEPGSALRSRTRLTRLTDSTRLANAKYFDYDIAKVPVQALTVGVGTILDAREVMILACGAHKAQAVAQAVEGSINHTWTVTALQLHPAAMLVCDEDAILELKVKTVRYFRETESD